MERRRARDLFRIRLRELRRRRGWNQQDLADALKTLNKPLSRVTITKIENGHRDVTLEEALELALALDVSPLWLLFPDPEELVDIGSGEFDRAAFVEWLKGEQALPGMDALEFHVAQMRALGIRVIPRAVPGVVDVIQRPDGGEEEQG